MINHFFGECKEILIKIVNSLKGSEKRIYIAEIADKIGIGGQTYVAKEFNVGRDTIRKGRHELKSGIKCVDAFNARGRTSTEQRVPNFRLRDIPHITFVENEKIKHVFRR